MVERAVLSHLAPSGEAMIADVRRAMPDVDKSAVSRAVRSLYCKKFISTAAKKRSGWWTLQDAYVRHITLTPEGRAAIGAKLKVGPLGRLSVNSTDVPRLVPGNQTAEPERVDTLIDAQRLSVNSTDLYENGQLAKFVQTDRVDAYSSLTDEAEA
jgi:DNA-binding MarR family transcriptional regulator